MKLNPAGDQEWERKYSQDPSLSSIDQTAGGTFIGVGGTHHVFNIDANGNVPGCGTQNSSAVQPISFTVESHGPEGDGTFDNRIDEVFGVQTIDVNTTVETLCGLQPAQLEMTKTAPSTVTVGQDLTYTITIKNKGPGTAQAVTFTDPLPSSVTFVSLNSTQGTVSTGNPVSCNIGDLVNAGTVTITLVVRPNVEGQLSNLATVSGANSASVQASASTTALQAGTTLLTVASVNPNNGVAVSVSPNDRSGLSNGTTQFTRTYNLNTSVTLTAPATAGGNIFQKWQRDGADVATNLSVNVLMDASHTMTAVFAALLIFTETGTNNAVALDSVALVRGPFRLFNPFNFSADQRTRIIFFTSDLGLTQPNPSILTVQASGVLLPVENVGPLLGVPGFNGSYIVVRLPDGLPTGNLQLTITVNGVTSNTTTLSISP